MKRDNLVIQLQWPADTMWRERSKQHTRRLCRAQPTWRHRAAVIALNQRPCCNGGPDGAVEQALFRDRSRIREHDVVNPRITVAPATLRRAHPACADVPDQRFHLRAIFLLESFPHHHHGCLFPLFTFCKVVLKQQKHGERTPQLAFP